MIVLKLTLSHPLYTSLRFHLRGPELQEANI